VALPIVFTVISFGLVSYEALSDLDVLAIALIRLTLLAVVLRLGLTLWWLSRQRADLEALAASDPLTGLGNYRALQERVGAAVAAARATSGRPASRCSTSTTSRRSTTPSATPRAIARCRPAAAVLLMPLVFGGTTVALLEIYRRVPQAWTNTQVDRARVLAIHIAAALERVTSRRVPKGSQAPR
jgi:GAF domain-containing protein